MRASWIRKALFGSRSRTVRRAIRKDDSTTSLQLERLEDRFAPATMVWNQTVAGSFAFANGSNWVGGVAPGAGDIASFTDNIAGNETINFGFAATLQGIVLGDADNTNSFSLAGSAITLDAASGIVKNLGTGSTNTTADTIANAITLGANNTALTNNYASAGLSIGGTISGAFSVNKTGIGAAVLGGVNTFSGGTTIAAGTLSISSDANLGASAGGVTLNVGTLQFTGSGAFIAVAAARTITLGSSGGTIDTSGFGPGNGNQTSIAANITGSGPLTLNAHGDTSDSGGASNSYLALTGTNNFVGKVTISSGVVLAVDASFGNTANGVILSGGGLVATNSVTIARAISLSGSGILRTYAGTNVTFSGPIVGTGTLRKTDGGTVILTGSETYSGGTVIGGGTLQIGNGTTGSLGSGPVTDNGALVFDTSGNVTVAGVISGTGSLTQSGSGTLTLTGNNTYSGTTAIASGILQLGNGTTDGSIAGQSIVDNGTLDFNNANALTYGGTISGSGTLNKTSGGTLTLTGSSGNNISVSVSAGTLAGSGSVGPLSISSGATVAPGGATGSAILSTGAASFVSGSTFHADINGTTAGSGYDQLNITGAVNLNGATLAIAGALVPTPGSTFVLISNDAGEPVVGTFNNLPEGAIVSNNFLGSGLSARITYLGGGGNDVSIIVNTPPTISAVTALYQGPQANSDSGQSVAADSLFTVVGAPFASGGSTSVVGMAYVYSTATGALVATLAEPSPAAGDFGNSVAVSGTTVVVGAPGDGGGTRGGQAYVFSALTGALVATLAEPSPAAGDFFGYSVAISGTTVVVGALDNSTGGNESGRAYVFSATTGAFVAALAEPSPAVGDEFGASVAVSGTTVVVGAPGNSTGGHNSGRAYIFSAATGALVATLAEPSPAANDLFGHSVAVSGTTVVVGALDNGTGGADSGRVYVFSATTGALVATLAEPSPAAEDQFGDSVAVSGTMVVVGAIGNDMGGANSGRAYVFSATTGVLVATLAEPSPAAQDQFGSSVAVSGTIVVVGAPGNSTGGTSSGQAYVYSAATGALVAALAVPSPRENGEFGYSAAVSGTTVVVGAPDDGTGGANSGRAYVYDAITGALVAILAEPSPAADDQFGNSVAVSGTTVVVGAPGNGTGGARIGRAYVYSTITGALVATLAEPSPAADDQFGSSVAVSGTTVVVGAPGNSTDVPNSGRAYFYDATTGALVATLADPSPAAGDFFGNSVAVSGTTAVVGAYANSTAGFNSGRAFVFSTITGALVATLTEPSSAASDFFGYSVAASGTTVVVGAPGNSTAGAQSGRAYVFSTITGALVATLTEPSPAAFDDFGNSVAVSGTTVVIGAYGNGTGGTQNGRAYVFSTITGALVATLTEPSPAAPSDGFGNSVAVSGTTVVVGADGKSTGGSDQGAAYVQAGVEVADNTTAVTTVTAFDPDVPAQTLTYSILPVASGGGADAAKFQINSSTGVLSFLSPPNFRSPTDANGDNIYFVTVQASDGNGGASTRLIAVQVQSVATNQTTVYVDSDWSNLITDAIIADADPTQAGNQPATFGVNAFATLQGAADAVAARGTITLLAGATGAYPLNVALANPFTLNVPTGTVTVSGLLSGAAAFAKAGNGTLILSGANTFAGGVTVNRGKLQTASDAALGSSTNNVVVNSPGEFDYIGNTTSSSRVFDLNDGSLGVGAGATLTLNGAEIDGGFLKGPGTIATVAGASTLFSGSQAAASLTISALGADAFVNFAEKGTLNLAAGSGVTLSNVEIDASAQFNVSGTASASDFLTDGQMTVAGTLTNVGSDGFTFAGGSVTTINAGGSVDVGAADALVQGGFVTNNGNFGSSTHNVVVNFAGRVQGPGVFHSVLTENGGVYSPGNSPGPANLSGFSVNGGGTFDFEISDATGAAGTVDGWDMATVAPNVFSPSSAKILLSATAASPYTVDIDSRLNDGAGKTAGAAADFEPTQGYVWKFIDGTAAGTTVSGTFNPAAFAIVTSGFSNAFSGKFSIALGDAGKSLYVVYSPNVYADPASWNSLPTGTLIMDADSHTAGNQPATLNVTAFQHLPNAVSAAPAGGTVVVADGTYSDPVVLANAVTLSVAGAATASGAISGTGPLVKAGSGTLTLTAAESYAGNTTVTAGTLLVNGSITSSSAVTVAPGATLGGAGTIAGAVTSAGVVSPGSPGTPGALTVAGNLTLGTGALVLDLSNVAADSVLATGPNVDITGATLSLNVGAITPGESFTILAVPGVSGGRTGTFVGLDGTAGHNTITAGGTVFTISYTGGDGNDITLTATGTASLSIVSTVLNGGIAYVDSTLAVKQHSMVENVVYSFSQAVSLSASNFTLSGFQGTPASLVPNVVVSGSGAVWTVTFSGVGVNTATHSIGDGEYSLVLAGVPELSSNTFDFYRLLGDMDGDGAVSASDFSTLISTFLRAPSDPLYLGADDLDGDNAIGAADLSQFTADFLHTLPTPLPN